MPALAALLIFAMMVLFVLVLLRRISRISAVAALSTGATGRQSTVARLRLYRSRMPVHFRLGTMDVVGCLRTYLLLFFVFAVSTFIMIVPINSATTASAPGFINYMGTGAVDLRIDLRYADDTSPEHFSQTVEYLRADPDVATIAPMVTTRNNSIDKNGNTISLYVENGDHARLPVMYADGRAPGDDSEIALSLLALNQAGREVVDTRPIEVAGQDRDVTIVGSYQDITNGGKTAKSARPTDESEVMWCMIGVELAPSTDATGNAKEYADRFGPAQVADMDNVVPPAPVGGRRSECFGSWIGGKAVQRGGGLQKAHDSGRLVP